MLGQLGVWAGAAPHVAVAATSHAVFWWHAVFLGLSPAMLAAHLVAALVAGWWLRRGEAAVWRLVRLTAETAATTARACVAALDVALALATALLGGVIGSERGPLRTVAEDGRHRLPPSVLLRHAVIRRGPPGVAVAV